MVTDLNIRITMRMERGSHGISFKLYDFNEVINGMMAMGISRDKLAANLQMTLEELGTYITPTIDYKISEIRHLLGGVYLDICVDIVPE